MDRRGGSSRQGGGAAVTEMQIDTIIVGPRLREDVGDIDYLADLIEAAGRIIQPLEIGRDGTLRIGFRRLLAAKKLGMTHVPVRVVEEDADGADQS